MMIVDHLDASPIQGSYRDDKERSKDGDKHGPHSLVIIWNVDIISSRVFFLGGISLRWSHMECRGSARATTGPTEARLLLLILPTSPPPRSSLLLVGQKGKIGCQKWPFHHVLRAMDHVFWDTLMCSFTHSYNQSYNNLCSFTCNVHLMCCFVVWQYEHNFVHFWMANIHAEKCTGIQIRDDNIPGLGQQCFLYDPPSHPPYYKTIRKGTLCLQFF